MQEDNEDATVYNLDILQDLLFTRLRNICLEEDEPYFMINYKPEQNSKCFLTTHDINKHIHNGCLIFPKSFCKKLRNLADPIQKEQQQIREIVEVFSNKLRKEMTQLANKFADNLKHKLLPNPEPYDFLKSFHKGDYKEDDKLMQGLDKIIRKWDVYERNLTLSSIDNDLQEVENKYIEVIKEVEKFLEVMIASLGKNEKAINEYNQKRMIKMVKSQNFPTSFEQIEQININKGKSIPYTNGIDIHPSKNMLIAMGCDYGDLVIKDQDMNKEVSRIKLNNNSNNLIAGFTQNCLWSPSGDKIMVSTCIDPSIYIYDETGSKLLNSMEKTYTQYGCGAIWVSESEVIVGYADGKIKFFNVDEGKEIGNVKVDATHPWGMDCLDDCHLLVGDKSGTISNINWKNKKIEWDMVDWHLKGNIFTCLKLSQNKAKLLTGSNDNFVKLMKLHDHSKLWEFKLKSGVVGALWAPNESYVLALGYKNQLIALNSNDGTKIIELNELSSNSMSFRLNPRTAEIYVGNNVGTIGKIKIWQG